MPNGKIVLYRRVSPGQWRDDNPKKPEDALFYLRPNEAGLSVFDAELANPDAVLQHLLNLWTRQNRRNKLGECGGTTKGLRELGWGVVAVEVPVDWLKLSRFVLGTPDALGHLEIIGTEDDFETFAPIFVRNCLRVPESEFLI